MSDPASPKFSLKQILSILSLIPIGLVITWILAIGGMQEKITHMEEVQNTYVTKVISLQSDIDKSGRFTSDDGSKLSVRVGRLEERELNASTTLKRIETKLDMQTDVTTQLLVEVATLNAKNK